MGTTFRACQAEGQLWTGGWAATPLAALATMALALVPLPAVSQGWIEPPVVPSVVTGGFAVERVRSDVRVEVQGQIARFEVTEWFVNEGLHVAEGEYIYPLPGEAVFEDFSLYQGEDELRGEIMDAEEARAIYERIVRRRADPALIELVGYGLVRARVFPVPPGEERKVTIRYHQRLERTGDAYRLVHAGALRGDPGRAVRPMPMIVGGPSRGRPEPDVAPGSEPNALREPQTRALPEPVESSFEIRVADGDAFHEPFSPTHELDVERRDAEVFVSVRDFYAGRLAVFLPLADADVGVTVATHNPATEPGYFMLTLSPGSAEIDPVPRDVTAVLDVSGSMAGGKIIQARQALHQLLGSLRAGDRFRLIAFSNRVLATDETWQEWGEDELDRARRWVDELVANGGTDIGAALDEALRLGSPDDRLPVVVFLTDGVPTNGETSPERIADRVELAVGRTRIFAFGVGNDVNTHLLDRLGEAGRGSTDYVAPSEDVERAVGDLAGRISHPALTDVRVATDDVRFTEIFPVRVPDVFVGQELVIFGRYEGDGSGRVSVTGMRGESELNFRTELDFPRSDPANPYIPRLWAARKLGYLERQVWTEGETPDLVEEIRSVALRYGLPSRYTSYLVREPEIVASPIMPGIPGAVPLMGRDPAGRTKGPLPTGGANAGDRSATGASAVAAARRAQSFRRVTSLGEMMDIGTTETERLTAGRVGESVRTVGGRSFIGRDDAWVDVAHADDAEVITVPIFSEAYFEIVNQLTEIRDVIAELVEVTVAGVGVSLRFTSEPGATDEPLTKGRVRKAVAAFRGEGLP